MKDSVPVVMPDKAALQADANSMLELSKSYTIDNCTDRRFAAEDLLTIKRKAKELEDLRKDITRPLDASKKAVMNLFRGPQDWLKEAENTLKCKVMEWDHKAEMMLEAAQEKFNAQADAERARLEAEGDFLEAEMLPTPIANMGSGDVDGVYYTQTWKAEVVDKFELIQAVLERKVPDDILTVNTTVLNAAARQLKDRLSHHIPGTKSYQEKVLNVRAK